MNNLYRPQGNPGPVEIHTSDRIFFKRCRRRWHWSSPLRGNLRPASGSAGPLWMGTGFHFALEDYHGERRWAHPADAFIAYAQAHRQSQLPDDHVELTELACGMLTYYADVWLPNREQFETLIVDGVPCLEYKWRIPLEVPSYDGEVYYVGTFDRVVKDNEGRIWVVDYKTTARLETANLETDQQISAYTWAARQLFGEDVEGVIWMQFLKKLPPEPTRLQNGEFSMNKAQKTPYGLYRKALIEAFGEVPPRYYDFLGFLAERETPDGDEFIHMRRVRRSYTSTQSTYEQILAEAADMLNPDLPLYPNPTRDCSWDCPFRVPCITLDDGYDYQAILEEEFEQWTPQDEAWRSRLTYP